MGIKRGFLLMAIAAGTTVHSSVVNSAAIARPVKNTGSAKSIVVASAADGARALITQLRDAVNAGNAAGAAGLWADDGRYIDDMGKRYTGRDAIQKMFAEIFAEPVKPDVNLVVETLRFPAAGVASVDGTVMHRGTNRALNRFALTLVKGSGGWQISSAAEMPVVAASVSSHSKSLESLSWLIGDWLAQRDSAKVSMKAEWGADRHFILCRYEITKDARPAEIEMQVIGWEPRLHKPVSWHFNANGGFGGGIWSRRGDSWYVAASGVEPDGKRFTATNLLSGVNKDGFTWQSVNRRWDGVLVEDTLPIKVSRAAK